MKVKISVDIEVEILEEDDKWRGTNMKEILSKYPPLVHNPSGKLGEGFSKFKGQ